MIYYDVFPSAKSIQRSKDLIETFDSFFNCWPKEARPPLRKKSIYNSSNKLEGWEIQMALAGYDYEDIEVWHEDNILHIRGSNEKRDWVDSKFRNSFYHKIPCGTDVDLGGTKVELSRGILRIKIPIKEVENNRKYLFGMPGG